MATGSRLTRPLLYAAGASAIGGGTLFYLYRPRNIPGQGGPAVPLRFAENGTIAPPRFPQTRSRSEQLADLKRSGSSTAQHASNSILSRATNQRDGSVESRTAPGDGEPYDLLIIGGGATGAGAALDAATRGLRVAMVERDDFASGTSSKSTTAKRRSWKSISSVGTMPAAQRNG